MKIISISGKRGSGKTTLAKFLMEYGYYPLSLATELKERAVSDFSLTPDQVYGDKKEVPTDYKRTDGNPLTPRDILIRMGVFYRSIDPLYWCKILSDAMKDFGHERYVIDDIRFINEVNYFRALGAKFVRLERRQDLNVYKAALDDLSESELDTFKEWDALLPADVNIGPADLENFANYIATKVEAVNV